MPDQPIETEPHIEPPQEQAAPPQNGNGKEPETITEQVRSSRDMIPVGDRGVAPANYAQWIDIAKDICKAHLMLPKHLHGNAPVMAGLLEIAARFNLSPYMLASKTYVQNDRLCFEAQAFGALAYASKMLLGRLRFDFNGEGDLRTCTVTGRFKDDPGTLYVATTPPMKEVHPGHTQKDGKTYVKGSPLWDKDPEQQLAYFAERRWMRRFAPDIIMGMYTQEEIEQLDDYRVEQQGAIPLTADRLGQLDTGEGWQEGAHADLDLAALQPEQPEFAEPEPEPEPPKPPRPASRKRAQSRKPPSKAPEPRRAEKPTVRPARGKPGRRIQPPSRAEVQAAVKRAEAPRMKVYAGPPKWLDYVTKSDAWIGTVKDPDAAEERWDKERDLRDQLQVPMGERSRLRALLDRKIAVLRPKPKEKDDE